MGPLASSGERELTRELDDLFERRHRLDEALTVDSADPSGVEVQDLTRAVLDQSSLCYELLESYLAGMPKSARRAGAAGHWNRIVKGLAREIATLELVTWDHPFPEGGTDAG